MRILVSRIFSAPSRLKYMWEVGANTVSASLSPSKSSRSVPPLTVYVTEAVRFPGKPLSPSGEKRVKRTLFSSKISACQRRLSKALGPPWSWFSPSFFKSAYLLPFRWKAAPAMRLAYRPTSAPR